MSIQIIPATRDDVPELLGLIRELAIYEKAEHEVKATPELMTKAVFDDKYAECLIARKLPKDGAAGKGEAVGMALYFFTYSTWLAAPGLYLEDLYVKPSERNLGLGKRLFGELGVIAKEKGCQRMEWRVLKAGFHCSWPKSFRADQRVQWNEPSIAFYTQCLKADPQSEWEGMRIEGDEKIQKLIDDFKKP
ncbi:hypothetical protein B9479_003408 [Cryptococcus floricola]|uniref:N-acetyltransferase domain-containing protein n=1 Tax=Cryptococcus floricola TaxID=2591691 RepID=A0A5D3AWX0_9TREE|nr:hypothetical protein B9479_003408 [Cryptococcus floricola]